MTKAMLSNNQEKKYINSIFFFFIWYITLLSLSLLCFIYSVSKFILLPILGGLIVSGALLIYLLNEYKNYKKWQKAMIEKYGEKNILSYYFPSHLPWLNLSTKRPSGRPLLSVNLYMGGKAKFYLDGIYGNWECDYGGMIGSQFKPYSSIEAIYPINSAFRGKGFLIETVDLFYIRIFEKESAEIGEVIKLLKGKIGDNWTTILKKGENENVPGSPIHHFCRRLKNKTVAHRYQKKR